jgi:hypothetical protein
LDDLARELDGSALAEERDRLLRQLTHARQYVKDTEGELATERENVRLLRREVDVLRRQVHELMAPDASAKPMEATARESSVSAKTPATATETGSAEGGDTVSVLSAPSDSVPNSAASDGATEGDGTEGDGTETAPSAPSVAGCLIVSLAALLLIYLLIGYFVSLGTVALKPSAGRKPTPAGDKYIWDVAGSVKSEFAAHDDAPNDRLEGTLRLEAGRECKGKPVEAEWEIAVDGKRLKKGTAKVVNQGKGTKIETEFPFDSTAKTVTLSVASTGAPNTCDTFGLVWEKPRLSKKFDPAYAS